MFRSRSVAPGSLPLGYPQPLCATCGGWAACEKRGSAEPSYPSCRTPLLRVRLDRVQALFEAWRAMDGVRAPEALAMERALLGALDRDRDRFSDIFEASFALSEGAGHAYRFSYAFPGFRSDSAPCVAAALACAAPFGQGVTAATKRLLRAATERAVEQPLIGIAWDRGGLPRHKVYLQFRSDAGRSAAELAERVLGLEGLAERIGGAQLHMLGVDFGPRGLTGAKLYILHATLDLDAPAPALSPEALVRRLFPERKSLRNVLLVHRLTPEPLGGALPPPTDLDFGLAENDVLWEEIIDGPWIGAFVRRSPIAGALLSQFRIGVRRLSIGLGNETRTTVYYGLIEVEEP